MQWLYQELPHPYWDSLLNNLIPGIVDWSVSEEELNQVTITVRFPAGLSADFQQTTETLLVRLQTAYDGIPVSLSTSQYSVKAEDLWLCSQRLKNLIQQRCIPASSSVFLLE